MSIPNRNIESHDRFYPTLDLFIFFNLPQDSMSQYTVISFHPEMKEKVEHEQSCQKLKPMKGNEYMLLGVTDILEVVY